jgi:C4-dicarboxylate transporter, DctM subunit
MDVVGISLLSVVLLFVLIFLGVHVAVSLVVTSIVGIWLSTGDFQVALNILGSTAYMGVKDYIYGVIVLFVLMGLLANLSGSSFEIYNAFNILFRKIKGGLGMATVGANAVFAAITGVSVASAAVFSKISLDPMTNHKYEKKFALGTIAGSSVLGMLIPPSVLFILYGMLAEVSVGKLFLAGILPGILLSIIFCIGIYVMVKLKPSLIGGNEVSDMKLGKEDFKSIIRVWPIALLVVLILGGIYGGWFTATEAGAVGAFGAFLLVIFKKKMMLKDFWNTLIETGYTSASILLLLIAAGMYSKMLAMVGLIGLLDNFLNGLNINSILLIVIFLLILLILGTVLDSTSIMLISMPLMLPFVSGTGFDLIVFGVLAVLVVEMGLLTPPFGMVPYAMKSALKDKANIEEIFAGSMPFLFMIAITVVILMVFPQIITWLPTNISQ